MISEWNGQEIKVGGGGGGGPWLDIQAWPAAGDIEERDKCFI